MIKPEVKPGDLEKYEKQALKEIYAMKPGEGVRWGALINGLASLDDVGLNYDVLRLFYD